MDLFVLLVILVIGVVVVAWRIQEQRRKDMAALAARLGFTYSRDDPFGLVALPFKLFSKGDGRSAENVLSGERAGTHVKLFDYWYYVREQSAKGGSSRRYYRFSCALTEIGARCPHVSVAPEDVLSRLADHVGLRDLEFESEEFNRRFQVESTEPKAAYAIIDARMMEWLMSTQRFSFEVAGSFVLAFTGRLKPPQVPAVLEALEGFCAHVPTVVSDLYPLRLEGTR